MNCFVFRYFRHAAGALVIISKNLAQYININRSVLSYLSAQGGFGLEKNFETKIGSFSCVVWLPYFSILADKAWPMDGLMARLFLVGEGGY